MTEKTKVTDIKAFQDKGNKAMKRHVTREEFAKTIKDIVDNVNTISNYCMEDMNALYAKQVFPFQMNLNGLVELLKEKGVITQEELDAKVKEYQEKLIEQAKEIKENNEVQEETEK